METPGAADPQDVVDPWAVLESLPGALAVIDAGGRVCFRNGAWRRLDRAGAADQAGGDSLDCFAAAAVSRLLGVSRAGGDAVRAAHTHLEVRRADGLALAAELTLSPLHDGAGAVSHWVATVHDGRDREHELRVQRLRAESLGVLAGGFAHNFNNLLAVILGSASLALLDQGEPSPTREALTAIYESARRGSALVSQLLAFAGKGRLQPEVLDLNQLAAEAGGAAPGIPQHVDLALALEPGLPPVMADAQQLRRVLLHLLHNAVESIGASPGTITVRTATRHLGAVGPVLSLAGELPPGAYAAIEVCDTGRGLDRDALERVFEPFFSTKFAGRGLGLAEALGVVSSHGGGMFVESAVGAGATFTVLLPAVIVA